MTKRKTAQRYTARHDWTPAEIETLRERYPMTLTETLAAEMGLTVCSLVYKAKKLRLNKSHEFLSALNRAKNPVFGTRFRPGNVPFNKGLKGWKAGGRSAETQFKPQQINHNYLPVGSERINRGYLQRKLTTTGYPPRDWVCVHHILWREAGNDIPPGHRLVFKDGNQANITIENLELITIADLMRRNSCHRYGEEIAQLVQLRGMINRKINNQEKQL